jgi:hypothetical protein
MLRSVECSFLLLYFKFLWELKRDGECVLSISTGTHTHTHICVYIYIYMYVYLKRISKCCVPPTLKLQDYAPSPLVYFYEIYTILRINGYSLLKKQ